MSISIRRVQEWTIATILSGCIALMYVVVGTEFGSWAGVGAAGMMLLVVMILTADTHSLENAGDQR